MRLTFYRVYANVDVTVKLLNTKRKRKMETVTSERPARTAEQREDAEALLDQLREEDRQDGMDTLTRKGVFKREDVRALQRSLQAEYRDGDDEAKVDLDSPATYAEYAELQRSELQEAAQDPDPSTAAKARKELKRLDAIDAEARERAESRRSYYRRFGRPAVRHG
jgi:hypothetical protein